MPRANVANGLSRSGWSIGSPPLKATTSAEPAQLVDAPAHRVGRNRRRDLVVLVAIPAVDVALADRHDLDEQRMCRVHESPGECPQRSRLAAEGRPAPHACDSTSRRRRMRSPTFIEPLKIEPTGITPSRWWRATAARPAEAMQPQFEQSGAPPNWQGVMSVFRSAEMVVVVRAHRSPQEKTAASSGIETGRWCPLDTGGSAIRSATTRCRRRQAPAELLRSGGV